MKSLLEEYDNHLSPNDTHIIDLEDQPILEESRPLRSSRTRLFGSIRRHPMENNGMIDKMRLPFKGLMWIILTGSFIALIYYASTISKKSA